jgi:hypothetical protein
LGNINYDAIRGIAVQATTIYNTVGKAYRREHNDMVVDKYASRRFDIQQEDAIDVAVLEAIPFDYPD